MKNNDKKSFEIGPRMLMFLFIAGVVLLIFWPYILGLKIAGVILVLYSFGETGKKMGYKKGLEDGKRLKE